MVNGVTVYDDFAHHPTAIETTLAGLRAKVDGGRILAVLEPRSNTMKLGVMKDRLAASLAARRPRVSATARGCSGTPRRRWRRSARKPTVSRRSRAACSRRSPAAARPGDHVLVMSNGGFSGIHEKLLARLAKGSGRAGGGERESDKFREGGARER